MDITSNYIYDILIENSQTFQERNNVKALTEADMNAVNSNMVANLFKSAMSKSHIDFDNIPDSKGDITRYSGYITMVETLSLIRDISDKSGVKSDELKSSLDTVEKAISNVVAYRDMYVNGFKLNKDFIIMNYCAIVGACVEATSSIMVSFVNFVKSVDTYKFTIINTKTDMGNLCIKNLARYNREVNNGNFAKAMGALIKTPIEEGYNVLEESALVTVLTIGAISVVSLIALVALTRELIYQFYNKRMQFSDYLNMQAQFLELNKLNVQANSSNVPPAKKKEILEKQDKLIKKLREKSDKFKVNSTLSTKKTNEEIKKDNKSWTLDGVQNDIVSTDKTGFQLL